MLGFAGSMTYGGQHPRVSRVEQTYASGVCRSTKEMKRMEQYLHAFRAWGNGPWSFHPPKWTIYFLESA